MSAGLPIIKSAITPLAKSVLFPLGLKAVMSLTDAANQQKSLDQGRFRGILSNEEMEDIIKIVKYLKEHCLLGILAADVLENTLARNPKTVSRGVTRGC